MFEAFEHIHIFFSVNAHLIHALCTLLKQYLEKSEQSIAYNGVPKMCFKRIKSVFNAPVTHVKPT